MRLPTRFCVVFLSVVTWLAGTGYAAQADDAARSSISGQAIPEAAAASTYVLVAWSELGMHCMDGKDYSVFSVLPPYNTIHAQLLRRGEPPVAVSANVTVTYQAMADASGSINTTSANKSNFWRYVQPLFLSAKAPEMGLAGYATQSRVPRALHYNAAAHAWEAIGIPTMPYDDAGKRNAYSMVLLVAKDTSGRTLATAKLVLPVSDEMSCKTCHASGASTAARPKSGWVNSPNPLQDAKFNILKKHDDRWSIAKYLPALKAKGWNYQSSLFATALNGTPVLCAACHSDNALSLPGLAGIRPLSTDMHTLHGPQFNPATHASLDRAANDQASCYLCHPGLTTQCKRGAMNTQRCADCHGVTSYVGKSPRAAWLKEPSCQMCHNSSRRYLTTFASATAWRTTTDTTFATNANVPVAGSDLFRASVGHGKVACAACHGSPHAEFPTLRANDNVYSASLQGHAGTIRECSVCHANLPVSARGGPHFLHTIGQSWVSSHGDYAEGGAQKCTYCHGSSYRGSFLSQTSMARTFRTEGGTKSFAAGHAVSCYDCHNGPNGGD